MPRILLKFHSNSFPYMEIHCSCVYLDLCINDQLKKSVRKTKTTEKIRVDSDVTSVF